MRESPALDVIELLKRRGAAVTYTDPFVPVLQPRADRSHVDHPRARRWPTAATARSSSPTTARSTTRRSPRRFPLVVDTRNALKGLRTFPQPSFASRNAALRHCDMAKTALITGITGQDGSYLAELLLAQGLQGRRHGAPAERAEPLAHRAPARPRHAAARRSARPALAHQGHRRGAARRGLQPGGDVVRAGVVGSADADRRVQLPGRDPHARSGPPGEPEDPLLSGLVERDVRQGARSAADRADAVLSAQPLRRVEGVRPLHHGQLPRELRPVRLRRASSSTTSRRAAGWSS